MVRSRPITVSNIGCDWKNILTEQAVERNYNNITCTNAVVVLVATAAGAAAATTTTTTTTAAAIAINATTTADTTTTTATTTATTTTGTTCETLYLGNPAALFERTVTLNSRMRGYP